MKRKTSSLELYTYFCVWIAANLVTLYKLYETESEILQNNLQLETTLRDLKPGWKLISRLQDVSDREWSSWKYFFKKSWFYLVFQFMISEIMRNTTPSLLKPWYIISSVIFISLHLGYKQLIIIITQPMIFVTIIIFGGRRLTIWLVGVLLLVSYNSLKYKHLFWEFLDHKDVQDEEVYLILFGVAWVLLRCISFCIDHVDIKEKLKDAKDNNSSISKDIMNMFSYVLYLPLLYTGPVVLYEDFEISFSVPKEKLSLRLRRFIWDMIIFLFYTFLLDVAFHYIYFYAMQSDLELIRKFPTLALCGGGLWMGLEFHMKYVIFYGTTAAFARLDNIEPPPTPRCIARIHVYSQMWRYFDVGLYKFLVKYIYKPGLYITLTYSGLPKMLCRLSASLMTFVFIYMWHGIIWDIFVWSILNYLGITLEHLGKAITKTNKYCWFKQSVLKSDAMETRFVALLCAPLLTLSAISNFYLFAGSDVGNIFLERFVQPTLCNSVLIGISMYCCCHVSIALEDVPSRTDTMKRSKH